MAQFDCIKSYNRKYTGELDSAIRTIMPTLIEAYIRVFGEEHRDYINYTLTHINFIYFIPKYYFEMFLKSKTGISKSDLLAMDCYLGFLDSLKDRAKTLNAAQKEDLIIKNYITKSDITNRDVNKKVIQAIKEDCALFFEAFVNDLNDNIKAEKVVMLPILAVDIRIIIHELTHALTNNTALYTETSVIRGELFPNEESDELMNEYIARRVLKEYINLGGVIPKELQRVRYSSDYKEQDFLVSYFYQNLSPFILESLISGNHNMMRKSVGEDLFLRYCDKIKEMFNRKSKTQAEINEIDDLVDKMYDNILLCKKEDFNSFYSELESMGCKVRRLK